MATIEEIARCLAKEAQGRIDKKRGFTEVDDFADALAWITQTELSALQGIAPLSSAAS